MMLSFLQAELQSARFRAPLMAAIERHGATTELIERPDLDDPAENALRSAVLGEYRGWEKKEEIFDGWPSDVTWFRIELTSDEIGLVRYISYDYWDELSDNTHLVKVGADNIRAGKEVFAVSNDRFWAIAQLVDDGKTFAPLIVRSNSLAGPYELVEGHLRATAYALARRSPEKIEVILAVAPEFA